MIHSQPIIVRSMTVRVPLVGENVGTAEEPAYAEDGPFGLAAVAQFPPLDIDETRFSGSQVAMYPGKNQGEVVVVQAITYMTDEDVARAQAAIEKFRAAHMAEHLEMLNEDDPDPLDM